MKNSACKDSRERGMFRFYGANRTGRFAGRLVQLQNLPQNHPPDLAEARSLVSQENIVTLEIEIFEDELQPLVDAWRSSNPMVTSFWWDVDRAIKICVKEKVTTQTHGIQFCYQSVFLFIKLPSGRKLAYVKPRIGENQFGGESVTYEGVGATKKWERLESYSPKFVENIIQGIARDILVYAMKTLRNCEIMAHVHDEIIIEADKRMSLEVVC